MAYAGKYTRSQKALACGGSTSSPSSRGTHLRRPLLPARQAPPLSALEQAAGRSCLGSRRFGAFESPSGAASARTCAGKGQGMAQRARASHGPDLTARWLVLEDQGFSCGTAGPGKLWWPASIHCPVCGRMDPWERRKRSTNAAPVPITSGIPSPLALLFVVRRSASMSGACMSTLSYRANRERKPQPNSRTNCRETD